MIVTVTLNPALDRIVKARGVDLNKLNRVDLINCSAGGKGINVSHLLHLLGTQTVAMGFLGGIARHFMEEEIRAAGLTTNFVFIEGETRTNYIIIDEATGFQTQINEKGPDVHPDEIRQFKENFRRALGQSEMVVMAGSLPRGIGPEIYAELIAMANDMNVPTLLNVQERILYPGLDARPFLLKPDFTADSRLMGIPLNSYKNRVDAAQKLLDKGVQVAVISSGSLDQIIVTREKILDAKAPNVEVLNRVGAGGAFMGGIAHALARQESLKEAVRLGMAASVATSLRIGTKVETIEEISEYLAKIEIREAGKVEKG